MNADPSHRIVVIVRGYNEAGAIGAVVRSIRETVPGAAVLVVDDGSTDRTAAIARESGARVLSLPMNIGIGGATQAGIQLAVQEGYSIGVQIDGDGQHPSPLIPQLLQPIINGEADMVVGSRFAVSLRSGNVSSPIRLAANAILGRWLTMMTGTTITDPTSGFRAYERGLMECLARSDPFNGAEPPIIFSSGESEPLTIYFAIRRGFRYREVPVQMRRREHGRSSIGLLLGVACLVKVVWATVLDRVSGSKSPRPARP